MKKLVKKIVVAVMAMAMAIGMLAVTASADYVDVSAVEDWYVKGSYNGWSTDTKMTKDGDTFYADVVLPDSGVTYEFCIYYKDASGDHYINDQNHSNGNNNFKFTAENDNRLLRITVSPEDLSNGDNCWRGTFYVNMYASKADAGNDTRIGVYAGDPAMYIAIAAVAVVALGAVIILASKKKVVTE